MDGDPTGASARLADKDQIIDLVHEYSYRADHRLYDEVVELFTEGCIVDDGIAPPVHRRADLRPMFATPTGASPPPATTTPTSWCGSRTPIAPPCAGLRLAPAPRRSRSPVVGVRSRGR
ncbi:MAG: nuclear transport factor 2 family protein [Acidimicrobiales bacterium]